ncbi:hypothetical protein INR49_007954 [Caranx melampygus]|nr:hypothetical protein INR49_007954 [Caranx melampygus]
MQPHSQLFCLVLSALVSGSLSVNWDMVVSPEVTVSRGQDVVLSCSFTHPRQQKYSGLIRVKWLSQAGGQKSPPFFTCSLRNDSTGDHSSCSGSALRHSLTGDPRRGELSLLLRKVQLTDNGLYFCRVELDDRGDSFQKYTELHVRAEPQILSLSVVDSPSGSDGAPAGCSAVWRVTPCLRSSGCAPPGR